MMDVSASRDGSGDLSPQPREGRFAGRGDQVEAADVGPQLTGAALQSPIVNPAGQDGHSGRGPSLGATDRREAGAVGLPPRDFDYYASETTLGQKAQYNFTYYLRGVWGLIKDIVTLCLKIPVRLLILVAYKVAIEPLVDIFYVLRYLGRKCVGSRESEDYTFGKFMGAIGRLALRGALVASLVLWPAIIPAIIAASALSFLPVVMQMPMVLAAGSFAVSLLSSAVVAFANGWQRSKEELGDVEEKTKGSFFLLKRACLVDAARALKEKGDSTFSKAKIMAEINKLPPDRLRRLGMEIKLSLSEWLHGMAFKTPLDGFLFGSYLKRFSGLLGPTANTPKMQTSEATLSAWRKGWRDAWKDRHDGSIDRLNVKLAAETYGSTPTFFSEHEDAFERLADLEVVKASTPSLA